MHIFCFMFDDAIITQRLGDVATVAAGFPFRGRIKNQPNGNTVVAQMRNVGAEAGVDWANAAKTALPGRKAPQFLEDGHILFAARGARNYAVLVESPPERAVSSPHFFVITVKDPSIALPAFITWQINQAPVQRQLDVAATGSHIRNIRRQALENLRLAVPPAETQRVIVEFDRMALAERRLLEELIANRIQQTDALALGLFNRNGVQE